METTLEVLQAYPLGTLEVEITNWQGMKLRGVVIGLTEKHFKVRMDKLRRPASFSYNDKDIRLCLRPFSALVTPLEGGEVPIIEAAKNNAGYRGHWKDIQANLYGHGNGSYISVYRQTGPITTKPILEINHRWEVTTPDGQAFNVAGFMKELLAGHFAVGLSDTDFIAK